MKCFRAVLFLAALAMSSPVKPAIARTDIPQGSVVGLYEGNSHAEGLVIQVYDGRERHYIYSEGGVTPRNLQGKIGYNVRIDFRIEEVGGPEGSEGDASIKVMEKAELISGRDDPELCRVREQAEAEDSKACNTLGVWYEKGRHGLPKDPKEAVRWYLMASFENTLAMHNLGDCYRDGIGVEKDENEAAAWYKKAIKAGNPIGYEDLGNLYLRKGNKNAAREMYEKAAKSGRASAAKKLAEVMK